MLMEQEKNKMPAENRGSFKKLRLMMLRFFTFVGATFETLGVWFFTITIISCVAELIAQSDRFSSNKVTGVFICSGLAFMVLMFAVYSLLENLRLVRKISKMSEDELDKKSVTLGFTVLIALIITAIVIGVILC